MATLTFRWFIRSVAALCLALWTWPVLAGAPLPGPEDAVPGVVLVKFRTRLTGAEQKQLGITEAELPQLRSALMQATGTRAWDRIPNLGVERLRLTDSRVPSLVLRQLQDSPAVLYAQPNYRRAALSPLSNGPNDPYYQNGSQWWVEAVGADRVWAEAILPAPSAGRTVVIAILDSGIALQHEDLISRLVPGRDFYDVGGDASDIQGHGTHVAGIAAAATGNSLGVAGTASHAGIRLMPVKVLGGPAGTIPSGNDYDIAQAIIWAADQGTKVLNLSLGGTASGQVMEEAVQYAVQRGCLVVASGGNNDTGDPTYNPVVYPAAYPEVVAVAACDSTGARAGYSIYHDYIDLAAPGGNPGADAGKILSTFYDAPDAYAYAYGTSMSAPVVSGCAAMLWMQDPNRTSAEVLNLLITTADKTGSLAADADGWNPELGWGRVNLYRALTRQYTFKAAGGSRPSYNYPNPFRPARGEQTYIVIPEAATGQTASVRIFDSLGTLVRTLELQGAAVHAGGVIGWNGRNESGDLAANGVYPFVLEIGGKTYMNKIVVRN
ncbi:MAG: S8 family serine peptidase [candidate division FCPU426 bacterium]